MNRRAIYILVLFSAVLFRACSSKTESTQAESAPTEVVQEEEQDYWEKNNCMRSEPIPTLDSNKLESFKFTLDREKGEGVETAKLQNGDSLIIHDLGCEVYWMRYSYHVKDYKFNNSNYSLIKYCMEKVEEVNQAPIDFKGGLVYLDSLHKNRIGIDLGIEYFLEESDVSEFFQIDEINLKGKSANVVFIYAIGHQ